MKRICDGRFQIFDEILNVLQCQKGYAFADDHFYLFRCHHVNGCFIETSTEAFTTDVSFKGKYVDHFISDYLYVCCKVRQNNNGSVCLIHTETLLHYFFLFLELNVFSLNEFESNGLDRNFSVSFEKKNFLGDW